MKHTSGARVLQAGGWAVKFGSGDVGKRVETQGSYCRELGPAVCPHVPVIFRNGYAMERLREYTDFYDVCPNDYIEDVVGALEDHVWSKKSYQLVDWNSHREYVRTRAVAFLGAEDYQAVERAWESLNPSVGRLRASLTHGDPTFDNMMLRPRKGRMATPVIIDPLPPYENGEMPQLQAVDVGKIMQSLLGYEEVKYGASPWIHPGTVKSRFAQLRKELNSTSHEWRAAHWFLIAHLIRLIPYQPMEKREACRELLRKALDMVGDLP